MTPLELKEGKESQMKSKTSTALRIGIVGLVILGTAGTLPAQSVATVGELLAAVIDEGEDHPNYFVIPVAGHVEGANQTEFRTDVTILAAGYAPQKVAVAWLAQDLDNSARPLELLEVGPGPVFLADMVASALGQSGLGALVVAAVTPEGSIDRSARLHGFARVWTPVPGCSGTSSLAIEPGRFRSSFHGATGLRVDAGHRGNFGLVNPNSRPQTFKVSPNYPPVEVSVPAASMRQWPIPTANESGAPVEIFVGTDGGGPFAGYATSVDQSSGDGWLVNFGPPE